MAETIVSDAVTRILELLGSRAFQEIQLAFGVKDEILKLKDTVETINGVLLDAEKQFNKNEAVTVWLRRLKDAVYDADDLLDEFYTQLKLKEMMSGNKMSNEVRIFFSKSNQIVYALKMGRKVKTIRERLDDIKNDKQFLLFKHDNGKGVTYYNREREQTHSFEHEENVIGRDDDKKAILQLLLDFNDPSENNVSVISIVGIGGVGKTTLVQSIYNVEKIETYFELKMWVCVSDDFTLKTIVGKILKSADTEKDIEKLELDGLQKELRKQIDGKRYLLVLDDVWNDNANDWIKLHTLLKNGAKGSKILVTTREKRFANVMSKPPLIYVLRGLTKDKSWSLFTKIVFEQGKPKDSSLVAIGKEIVAKCVGVPLAIRTIGNILHGRDIEYWLSFRDKGWSEIDQKKGDILPILALSYDHLSSQLKQCFAYCALFPKDYHFEREKLIQLWMAQGFLGTSKKNQCLEDVGNEYFMELLSGSFLQDLKEDKREWRKVMTCKMHDLMHDLAQSVVSSECKMVTIYIDNNIDERSRHISFDPHLNSLEISTAMLKGNRLRTFLPLCSYIELNNYHCRKIISKFRYLRTLSLSHWGIKKVPTLISKLKLLRYLNLSWNGDIIELPNSVSKLINLQTLDLCGCRRLKKLPRDMRKMSSLQYLMIDGCVSLTSMPHGLGQLTALQTLPLFVVGKKGRKIDALQLRELNKLNKLRGRLTITILGDKENVNFAEANLEQKQYLESIRLEGYGMMVESLQPHPNLKELSISGLGSVMFSGCMSSFTNLTTIDISDCSNFQNITPLDQLPSLISMALRRLISLEYISASNRVSEGSTSTPPIATTTFFPSLQELRITDCGILKGWWKINNGEDDQVTTAKNAELLSFPCLSQLYISNCPMLTSMPLYPTLEKLDLYGSSTKTLQQTMMMKTRVDAEATAPSTSYYSALALSSIKVLILRLLNDFDSLPGLLQRATSLKEIDISDSPTLISQLSQSIRYLSSLERLTMGGYEQLDVLQDYDDKQCKWRCLRSLGYIRLARIEKMVSLPKWIHHITTVQSLTIINCRNLLDLPEGMQLKRLKFIGCPLLLERYGNNKGVDWAKISHIPNIQIDYKWIQLEGCYQLVEDGDEQ